MVEVPREFRPDKMQLLSTETPFFPKNYDSFQSHAFAEQLLTERARPAHQRDFYAQEEAYAKQLTLGHAVQSRMTQVAASGGNVLRDYHMLFKRKEAVTLLHKWSSEDDDEGADIVSSGSGGQEEESLDLPTNFSKEALNFNISGIDLEIEGDRFTGTFANKVKSPEKPGSRTQRGKPVQDKSKSPVNKPANKAVIKANRANVRMSQKQSLR